MTSALLLLLCAQVPDVRLDYTANALPLRAALKELSEQAKVPLTVTRELENEPIILRFKDVPLKEAMGRIASTIEAEWVKTDDGGHRLQRSAEIVRRLERESFQRRAETYRIGLQRLIDDSKYMSPFTRQDADRLAQGLAVSMREGGGQRTTADVLQTEMTRERLPVRRLMAKVLTLIDPHLLALVEPGDRVVLSPDPTGMQVQLDGFRPEWLEQMAEEQKLILAAFDRLEETGRLPAATRSWHGRTPADPGLRVLVTFQSYPSSPVGQLSMMLVDSEDQIRASEEHRMRGENVWRARMRENDPEIARRDPRGVAVSRIARELNQVPRELRIDPAKRAPLSKSALEAVLHPEKIEPLSFSLGDVVLATAERDGVNAVVHATDLNADLAVALAQTDTVRPDQFFQRVARQEDFEMRREQGWIIGRCLEPLIAQRARMPRPLFGEFMRLVHDKGSLSLDDLAHVLVQVTDEQFSVLPAEWWHYLQGGYPIHEMQPFGLVRFYASLTEGQWAAVRDGGTLHVADLTQGQRGLLESLVYRRELQIWVKAGDHTKSVRSKLNEPTEAFPSGIPGNAEIKLTLKTEPCFYLLTRRLDGETDYGPRQFSEFAGYIAQGERLDLFPFMADEQVESGALGESIGLSISLSNRKEFEVNGHITMRRQVGARLPMKDLLASLPEDVTQRLDRELARLREGMKRFTPGQPVFPDGPGQPAPPPLLLSRVKEVDR